MTEEMQNCLQQAIKFREMQEAAERIGMYALAASHAKGAMVHYQSLATNKREDHAT